MSIYKKLLTIQKQVKGLSKDKKSHNFSYVTGNKLLSFIKPLMDEQGLLLKQEVLSIDNDRIDYTVNAKRWQKNAEGQNIQIEYEKPKSEILSKVMMRFTWIDSETGERDENLFGANGQNGFEMGLGSALTYAERYFILKYFHIATDEDDIDNPDRKKDESIPTIPPEVIIPSEKLRACKTREEMKKVYTSLTRTEQKAMASLKDELKLNLK